MKKAIIVDIDGTVANITKRVEETKKRMSLNHPDFHAVCNDLIHTDTVIPGAKTALQAYPHTLIYLSGRRNTALLDTLMWWAGKGLPFGEFYLRPTGMLATAWKAHMIAILCQNYKIEHSYGDMESDKAVSEAFGIKFTMIEGEWV